MRGILLSACTIAALIYCSSVVDWMYVRPHFLGSPEPVCRMSTTKSWRLVTRIRLAHRLAAVLGFLAGLTTMVALAANHWVKPIDETIAGAIAGVATVVAGYYLTRAAPLVAQAMNPAIQISDVVELAEEFNVADPAVGRWYFVVDVAWEGVKLLELQETVSSNELAVGVSLRADDAASTQRHDRVIDVGDIARLVRRRRAMTPCRGTCVHLAYQCLGPPLPEPVAEHA